jgi:hypothetical protein
MVGPAAARAALWYMYGVLDSKRTWHAAQRSEEDAGRCRALIVELID